MKKSIKTLLFISILVAIISLAGVVNATSVSMGLSSTSKLVAGDTVEVILKINSIDAGDGIDSILATLEYDKNIFDEVTEDSFETQNKWSLQIYNTENNMFILTKSSKVNTNSDILKLTLKVKDGVTVTSANVKVKDITVSGGSVDIGGTGDIVVPDTTIAITKAETSTNTVVNTVVNTVSNEVTNQTQTANKVTNQTQTTNTSSNTQSTGKLPQTGEGIGITIGIATIFVVAIIAYIKYRNINIK